MNLSESYKNRIKLLSGIISESEVENAIVLNKVVHSYLHAALWTSELDSEYDIPDIDDDSISKAVEDCRKFTEASGDLLNNLDLDEDQIGRDFWLSRNSFGSGFYDRNLGDIGDKLYALSKTFNEKSVFEEDGKIFLEE